MFTILKKAFESIKPDLIFLHVGVNEHHAFNFIVNAVSNEIVLQNEVLPKHKSKVSFGKQLINESIIFTHQLIQYVLQNGSYLGEWEHIILSSSLDLLVSLCIMSQVFHRNFLWLRRMSKCWESIVALFYYKLQVIFAILLIEYKLLLVSHA